DTVDMSLFPAENIRNFSIVAHVDHGKSTLADRLLEITGAIAKTGHNKQVLDKLQVERERGITVKAQTASLIYNHQGTNYLLNLIDTPGHVDFNYEVSRSLSACQGVLLVVDANQVGIDLKNANPEVVENQIENTFDILKEDCIRISAKLGTNVERILQEVIERIPPPAVNIHEPLKALVFDSTFDTYRGVIANIALLSGEIHKGHKITTAHTKKIYEVHEIGILTPNEQPTQKLLGFLGLLHMEVFNQRLEQEHNASVILTAPTVPYKAILSSPKLIKTRRAVQKDLVYIDEQRVMMVYLFPLNEIVVDFFDALKSLSSGYASFDYEDAGYQPADLVKVDILLNGKAVEELITIVPREKVYSVGKAMCERLRDLIPRQMFEIAIQAALGNKIIARETRREEEDEENWERGGAKGRVHQSSQEAARQIDVVLLDDPLTQLFTNWVLS
ncbi:hypothetical protein Chor_015482, partial [Crotalus horridus]